MIYRLWFIAFLLFPSFLSAQGLIVSQIKGNVEYRESKIGEWQKASVGLRLSEKGSVRTGENSRAALIFHNGSKVWLKPKTNLDVDEQKDLINQLNVLSGTVKVRVPHLKRKEKFLIKSPTSLAAVRGTEFVFFVDEQGQSSLDVLFGEVRLDIVEKESNSVTDSFRISQGNGFGAEKVTLLKAEQEVSGMEDWSPETPDENRGDVLQKNASNRSEIRQFAQMTQATESEMASSISQVKEEDFAAGRTLTDVHGNLVRVDQRLDRPDNKTIQVLNVVKREGYASGGFRKFKYNGSSGARFDSVRAKAEFNKALPDSLTEFPGFFIDNKNTIKVDRAEVVMANSTDPDNVFTIGFFGKRNPDGSSDEIDPDLYVGTLQTAGGVSARKQLSNLKLDSDGNVSGLTRFQSDKSISRIEVDGVNGELYGNGAERWTEFGNAGNKIWLCSEHFIINNSGNVRNVTDFTNGTANFESLLKNSAAEMAAFIKTDDGTAPNVITDAASFTGGNPLKRNVDLVIVPDLALSIVKSFASSMDAIKNAKE